MNCVLVFRTRCSEKTKHWTTIRWNT